MRFMGSQRVRHVRATELHRVKPRPGPRLRPAPPLPLLLPMASGSVPGPAHGPRFYLWHGAPARPGPAPPSPGPPHGPPLLPMVSGPGPRRAVPPPCPRAAMAGFAGPARQVLVLRVSPQVRAEPGQGHLDAASLRELAACLLLLPLQAAEAGRERDIRRPPRARRPRGPKEVWPAKPGPPPPAAAGLRKTPPRAGGETWARPAESGLPEDRPAVRG